tara:strand:+ start:217 stop:837 length:621 start_codon:yes stop_codon:yes gene_type:complete
MSGQINGNTKFGQILYELSRNKKYTNYVEIGTWNGQGSTKCIMDGLLLRRDLSVLYSLETNKKFYDMAYNYWAPQLVTYRVPKLNLIYGRIVESEDISSVEEIQKYDEFDSRYLDWRAEDAKNYKDCKNVIEKIPETIDVLLLDGGEFTSYAEYLALKDRTKLLVLDDSRVFKNKRVRSELMNNKDWKLLHDNLQDRNGVTIFERS